MARESYPFGIVFSFSERKTEPETVTNSPHFTEAATTLKVLDAFKIANMSLHYHSYVSSFCLKNASLLHAPANFSFTTCSMIFKSVSGNEALKIPYTVLNYSFALNSQVATISALSLKKKQQQQQQ